MFVLFHSIIVTVSLEDSLILVNESDGSVSVCVSVTGINTPDSGFNVSLSAISDTAVGETLLQHIITNLSDKQCTN